MRTVKLGRSGLEVTPLAYGTWQFGGDWGPVDERAAIAAIQHARSLGINFFDTAQAYGFGRSERLLGTALAAGLRPARESVVIATKGGLRINGDRLVRDASPAWLRKGVEASLDATAQIDQFAAVLPVETVQPPYHLFRRDIEADLLPYAKAHDIGGLALAWVLARPAVQVAIVGARTPAHLTESLGALDLPLSQDDLAEIDRIMAAAVPVGGPTPEGMT